MMPEPTKAEIAQRKMAAGRAALTDSARHQSIENKAEPTREDFELSSDFDILAFDAFIKKRDRLSLAIKAIIFAILSAFFVSFLSDHIDEPNYLTNYLGPIGFSYILVFVFPFTDYVIKLAYGDSEHIENAHAFRIASKKWRHFQTVCGEGYWRSLRGSDLEWAAAKVFRERGWGVRTTPTTADGGVDLILTYGNTRFCCQCKGHAKPVSVGAVREIAGVCAASNAVPMLVVVNGVTGPAAKAADELSVVLWDSKELAAFARGESKFG